MVHPNDKIQFVCCVDDTDDLTKTTSTGAVADALAELVIGLGGTVRLGVSRHQLPRLSEIAYTSHNSSMAFEATLPNEDAFQQFRIAAAESVLAGSVEAADPGLAVFRLPGSPAERQLLSAYGERAKRVYISKGEAYQTAAAIEGMSLAEYGGTGQGVVGALAGIALRLSGNDGRFRGKVKLAKFAGTDLTVASLVERFGGVAECQVANIDGSPLPTETQLSFGDEAKAVLMDAKFTFLARQMGSGEWRILGKSEVKDADPGKHADTNTCSSFTTDNDLEECEAADDATVCANCLYRRWTEEGMLCVART